MLFVAINLNYDHKQQTLKHRNAQNVSKSTNHRSQTMTFWTHLSKVLFPKKSSKMVDGRVKRKHQLTFELQSFLVFLRSAVITMVTMKHVHVLQIISGYLTGLCWYPLNKGSFCVKWEEKCLKQAEPFLMCLRRWLVLHLNFS